MRSTSPDPVSPDFTSPDDAAGDARRATSDKRGRSFLGVLRLHAVDVILLTLAGLFFAVAWPTFFVTHDAWTALVPLLAALGTLPVAVSRRWPLPAWCAVTIACLVAVPLRTEQDFALGWPVVFHLALAVCLGAAILLAPPKRVAVAVAVTVALMAFNPGLEVRVGWMVGAAVFSTVMVLVRWLLISRRQLESSSQRLERESRRSAQQADLRVLAEERNRLARDLHDVVAHQMSMIVVQSQSAPYRLQGVTPAVHAEFDSIAETAREALDEVRGLLGVLRTDAEEQTTEPVGIDQIEPTLRAARRSGIDITWQLTGEMDRIDETTGVVLHRVLQESLANASRHAPGGVVVVTLTADTSASTSTGPSAGTTADTAADSAADPTWNGELPPSAVLEVDNGPAAPGALVAPGTGGGSGIAGMSARVRAVGGSFSALPASDGGFTVTASVPLRSGRRGGTRLLG